MNHLYRLIIAAVVSFGIIAVTETAPTVSAASGCTSELVYGGGMGPPTGARAKCTSLGTGLDGSHEFVRVTLRCTQANGSWFTVTGPKQFYSGFWSEYSCGNGLSASNQGLVTGSQQCPNWPYC